MYERDRYRLLGRLELPRQAEECAHPAGHTYDRDDQPGRVSNVIAVPIAMTPSP